MTERNVKSEWNVKLVPPFQSGFNFSTARFPAFVAAWGTGKTMVAILKGMNLSELYSNNLGLIVRKSFTDLRDSTLADFTRYTKGEYVVPMSTKDVILPNGSKIMFRHLDELAGITQNVNLGWFFIEQAEEFDSDVEFELLGGRLRRVLTPSKEVQKELVGLGDLKEVVADFGTLGEGERLAAESALITKLGQPLRQGFIIANTNGHNWIWRKWKNKGGEQCLSGEKFIVDGYDYGLYSELFEAKSFDNAQNLPADFIESLRIKEQTSPALYRRCVENSWEEMDTTDRVIPFSYIYSAVNRDLIRRDNFRRVVSCDPAEFGDDMTVIYGWEGPRIIKEEITSKKEPTDTAGRIIAMKRKIRASMIGIDSDGIGSGIASILNEKFGEDEVLRIKSGASANDKTGFNRKKAEMWWYAREQFENEWVTVPDDEKLIEELAAVTYVINSKGQVVIERKKDTKKRLGRSPDRADAFVIGLWTLSQCYDYEPDYSFMNKLELEYEPLTYGLK